MQIKNLVSEGVLQDLGEPDHFLWEDAARGTIKFDPESNLLRAAEMGQRQMVRGYLSSFDKLIPGCGMSIDEKSHSSYIGSIQDSLYDLILVPTDLYMHGVLTTRLSIPAAAKAYHEGIEKVELCQFDRDKQDWFWFTVTGDFRAAAETMEEIIAGRRPKPVSLTVTANVELTSKLDKHLWGLNAAPSHRKTKVIHPSEISTSECDRQIGYGLLGEEARERVDPKLRRIFDVGHVYHDVIQRSLGWTSTEFKSEVRVRHKDLKIEGSCDGTILKQGLEIKSMGSNSFRKLTKAKSEHVAQATIYGALLDLESVSYLYVCKDSGEISEFDVPVDRPLWHQIATRAEKILEYTNKGELPEGIDKPSVCRSCKYAWTCKPENNPVDKKRMFSR